MRCSTRRPEFIEGLVEGSRDRGRPGSLAFPASPRTMQAHRRLQRRADFEYTKTHGTRRSDALFVMGVARSQLVETRFGLAVGRRVGKATVRNRVKRRLREALRSTPFREGLNVVVSARPSAASAGYWQIRRSIGELAERSGALRDSEQESEDASVARGQPSSESATLSSGEAGRAGRGRGGHGPSRRSTAPARKARDEGACSR